VAAVEPSPAQRELKRSIKGIVYWKSDPDYELARGRAVWRANKPNRFPAVIVIPNDAADVVTAVRYAKKHGLKVGTRSGGHSWQSPHVRDGAMLLDLSKMQSIEVDPATQTVWTNPGVLGSAVNFELATHGLITPTAHHIDVGIGGFVLCGGFGWNSRLWGNGSEHVVGLELVTADGDLIRADAGQNSDFYRAARGAGAGFFGVVTRLRLAAHPTPPVWRLSVYSYPVDLLEDVFTWARGISDRVAPNVELVITTSAHDDAGAWAPIRITVAALAITDTEAEAASGLAILDTCVIAAMGLWVHPVVAADLKRGEILFQTCTACHSPLGDGLGPDLHGIFGHKSAQTAGYDYSASMKAANLTWNEETLRSLLKGPQSFVPGTKMTFPGYSNPSDIDDVIAYIKQLK
jgi:FAD/FMN-containing dehydrogenase